jgi:hypothetical protein
VSQSLISWLSITTNLLAIGLISTFVHRQVGYYYYYYYFKEELCATGFGKTLLLRQFFSQLEKKTGCAVYYGSCSLTSLSELTLARLRALRVTSVVDESTVVSALDEWHDSIDCKRAKPARSIATATSTAATSTAAATTTATTTNLSNIAAFIENVKAKQIEHSLQNRQLYLLIDDLTIVDADDESFMCNLLRIANDDSLALASNVTLVFAGTTPWHLLRTGGGTAASSNVLTLVLQRYADDTMKHLLLSMCRRSPRMRQSKEASQALDSFAKMFVDVLAVQTNNVRFLSDRFNALFRRLLASANLKDDSEFRTILNPNFVSG